MSSTSQVMYGSIDQAGNQTARVAVDSQGRLQTSAGTSAPSGSTTAVSTNSSGARYNATPPTFTDGQLAENQADSNGYQKVVIGAKLGVNRSATLVANTAQTIIPQNLNRNGFFIKNDTASDAWVNLSGVATAVAGGGNLKVGANGGYLELKNIANAVSIISTAAIAVTALEF